MPRSITKRKHADDRTMARVVLFKHLKKFSDPSRMVFYVDGAPALEKKETHRERDERRVKALKTVEVAVETHSDRLRQGKPPTKQMFKNVEKGLQGAFKWSLQDREDFVEYLQGQRLDARLCGTEADVAIATDCRGTNSFLTEARNVFRTAADVESLLAADPSRLAVLSLDLDTPCIVGATVSLPPGQTPATLMRPHGKEGDEKKKQKKTRQSKRNLGDRKRQRARTKARKLVKQPQIAQFFDLVVKRKAVSRPTDSFASWLEDQKENTAGASTGRSIQPCHRSREKAHRFASTLLRVGLVRATWTTFTTTPTTGSTAGTPKFVGKRSSTRSRTGC